MVINKILIKFDGVKELVIYWVEKCFWDEEKIGSLIVKEVDFLRDKLVFVEGELSKEIEVEIEDERKV